MSLEQGKSKGFANAVGPFAWCLLRGSDCINDYPYPVPRVVQKTAPGLAIVLAAGLVRDLVPDQIPDLVPDTVPDVLCSTEEVPAAG